MSLKNFNNIITRLAGMVRRDLSIVPTYARYEYRRRWGGSRDRRLHPAGGSVLPAIISLNPTRRCNLACRMCFQFRHKGEIPSSVPWYDVQRELPLEAWVKVLDEASDWRLAQLGPNWPQLPLWARFLGKMSSWRPLLYITGGEPLVYPQILGLLEAARQRRFHIHLQTNGVLLAGVADDLVSLGVSMVTVSLDGPPEVHDYIRGVKGSFRRAAAGFQALAEARHRRSSPFPFLCLRCTISKDNLDRLEDLVPLARELGADMLSFSHSVFSTPEQVCRHNLLLSGEQAQAWGLNLVTPSIPEGEYYQSEIGPEDVPRLEESLAAVRRKARGVIPLSFSPDMANCELAPYYLDLDHPFPQECRHLWMACRILPDGTVSPCLHLVMGNITEAPLQEIWNSPVYLNLRRQVAEGLFPGCARCCYRRFQ
jgi:MoaA/NifB/PqqE/SkfB family radical SAM enzyme